MGHIEGIDHDQLMLFPEALDDYIAEDNPARFLDAFIDNLDLMGLDFAHAVLKDTNRPPYRPGDMLQLHILATSTVPVRAACWRGKPGATWNSCGC